MFASTVAQLHMRWHTCKCLHATCTANLVKCSSAHTCMNSMQKYSMWDG